MDDKTDLLSLMVLWTVVMNTQLKGDKIWMQDSFQNAKSAGWQADYLRVSSHLIIMMKLKVSHNDCSWEDRPPSDAHRAAFCCLGHLIQSLTEQTLTFFKLEHFFSNPEGLIKDLETPANGTFVLQMIERWCYVTVFRLCRTESFSAEVQGPLSSPTLANLEFVSTFVSFCVIWGEFELSEKSLLSELFVPSDADLLGRLSSRWGLSSRSCSGVGEFKPLLVKGHTHASKPC